MNSIKRFSGIIWMAIGPVALFFLLRAVLQILDVADKKISGAADAVAKAAAESARSNTILQWSIMIAIFIPIVIGLVIFGYYALKGEYSKLPESSSDIV